MPTELRRKKIDYIYEISFTDYPTVNIQVSSELKDSKLRECIAVLKYFRKYNIPTQAQFPSELKVIMPVWKEHGIEVKQVFPLKNKK